jgi:hypothetical protein
MRTLTLTDSELAEICPDVKQPAAMVRHLHAEGFKRARLRDGRVILERSHYEAVCRGEFEAGNKRGHNAPKMDMSAVS